MCCVNNLLIFSFLLVPCTCHARKILSVVERLVKIFQQLVECHEINMKKSWFHVTNRIIVRKAAPLALEIEEIDHAVDDADLGSEWSGHGGFARYERIDAWSLMRTHVGNSHAEWEIEMTPSLHVGCACDDSIDEIL